MEKIIYAKESYEIIGACMEVHRRLGCGFLEAVYQEALEIEFNKRRILFEKEKLLNIKYRSIKLTQFYKADFVCFDKIIIELKAITNLSTIHEAQVLNYLKITDYKLGIIVNFGKKSLEYKRFIL